MTEDRVPTTDWECDATQDGRRCTRPAGHKGMHRKRVAIEAEAAQPAPALDVERLARAMCWTAHGTGPCVAMADHRWKAEGLAAEYARLGSTPSRSEPHHAWCHLPTDHPGLCEGDQ